MNGIYLPDESSRSTYQALQTKRNLALKDNTNAATSYTQAQYNTALKATAQTIQEREGSWNQDTGTYISTASPDTIDIIGSQVTPAGSTATIAAGDNSGTEIDQRVENAVRWAERIAADNTKGYAYGAAGPDNYDCSGFVWKAFQEGGGFNIPDRSDASFEKAGFQKIAFPGTDKLIRGDILLRDSTSEHEGIYIGNGQHAAAHSASFPKDEQIDIPIPEPGPVDYTPIIDPNADTITVTGVCKTYKGRRVVNKASLFIKKGEIVGLLGPNGAGKTTTFYMVVGLVKPDEGHVFYNDKDITKLAMYQRARVGVGYLPQEASVFRKLTVKENINIILEGINISEKERKQRLESLLEDLDIGRLSDSLGYALSGGERRRVEIARALAAEPSFILLDEPFAGVDPIAVNDIQSIVLKLQKEKGLGILITDHNVRETLAIVDRAYIMNTGTILVSGTAQSVAQDPIARKYYLGDKFRLDRVEKYTV